MLQTSHQETDQSNQRSSEEGRTHRIRELNDRMRQSLSRFTVTAGIQALGNAALHEIAQKVRAFNDFTEANDPWSEHDFGAFDHDGQKIFWKIDYYNQDLSAGSPDPADPTATCRVLTVLLASEY